MPCLGNDCFIVRQEARNPLISINPGKCSGDQVKELQRLAERRILAAATETRSTCPDGCRCAAKEGAKPEATKWERVPVAPFSLSDGDCTLSVLEGTTVETRIVRIPGICKRARITTASVAVIAEGIEVATPDASQLSAGKIEALRKVLGR